MASFITFEGIEGSGKTTQIKLLSKHLKSKRIKHVLTREPGGTELGDRLRKLVLIPRFKSLPATAELFIMLAARADHVARVVEKNLGKGITVICDRFTDASLAYQGGGRRLNLKLIDKLNNMATGGIKPDLTILLDLPVTEGLRRAKKRLSSVKVAARESRFENEKLKFHKRVRATYLKLQISNRKRIKKINGMNNIAVMQEEIREIILDELKRHKGTGKGKKRASKIR